VWHFKHQPFVNNERVDQISFVSDGEIDDDNAGISIKVKQANRKVEISLGHDQPLSYLKHNRLSGGNGKTLLTLVLGWLHSPKHL
jgi:hypothetical protein